MLDAVGTLIRPDPGVAAAYHAAGLRHGADLPTIEIQQRFQSAIARHSVRNFARNRTGELSGPVVFENDAQPDETLLATDPENERQRWRSIVSHVFADHGAKREAIFNDLWEHFAQPGNWRPFDDAVPLVRELQRRGYQVGVASNFDERLPPIIDHYFSRFDLPVYVSSRLASVKPSRRFFQEIERRESRPAADFLLVGDDPENDYHAARAAGWQACLIDRCGSLENHEARPIPRPDIVTDMCDLLKRLPRRS